MGVGKIPRKCVPVANGLKCGTIAGRARGQSSLHVKRWITNESADLRVGDFVRVKEDRLLPLQWQLSHVEALHPGKDGVVRVATIKTARPVMKLCPLPTQSLRKPTDQRHRPARFPHAKIWSDPAATVAPLAGRAVQYTRGCAVPCLRRQCEGWDGIIAKTDLQGYEIARVCEDLRTLWTLSLNATASMLRHLVHESVGLNTRRLQCPSKHLYYLSKVNELQEIRHTFPPSDFACPSSGRAAYKTQLKDVLYILWQFNLGRCERRLDNSFVKLQAKRSVML
ncbi:hypothetical protein PR048_004978 [Dryococelus australis]|uniref:DUF5641 domain-containing protein n=1 Tax=Dryococelus australis TaxID=614101 RepID=A0ABQ9I6W8_9NEOP|nr:hypothetical protein PR048_004978 [Dryococelus australis]